jgi:hypothetical protein
MVTGFQNLYKSRWVCGVVVIPDGRLMIHRRIYTSGPTKWFGALRSVSYGPINPKAVMFRLAKEKFGVMPEMGNIQHLLTRVEDKTARRPTPAWDYSAAYDNKIEILIYKILYPKTVDFRIKHGEDDVMPMPFIRIVEDVRSGAWEEFNITIFDLLNEECKGEFEA